jgi:hypothetical protein
MPLYNMTEE